MARALKKNEYIDMKCLNTPSEMSSGTYEIELPIFGGGIPKELLMWKDKLQKALKG